MCLTLLDGSIADPTSAVMGMAPSESWVNDVGQSMSMVEQPGYRTGLLRDLGKVEFMNHPNSGPHNPINLRSYQPLAGNTDFFYDANTATGTLGNESANATDFIRSQLDTNMDFVYVRIHPRVNNGSTSNGSQLLTNLIQNVEVHFTPESDFSTFQTINKMDKNAQKVADDLNNTTDGYHRRSGGGIGSGK
jgi:hypothetical protein